MMIEIFEQQFDLLNFHDNKIHGIGFCEEKYELLIDIDFIEKWIERKDQNKYNFQIFPATLVFQNVYDVNINISMNTSLTVDSIERSNPKVPKNIKYLPSLTKEYSWIIELLEGEIQFKSIGFNIYQRKNGVISNNQYFELEVRGGISLEKDGIKMFQII